MDVSLLTSVLDRLVPGSVAMTPAALKHAQSKHSGVGSEGVAPQRLCSALPAASPSLSKGLWANGASPPTPLNPRGRERATVSQGSPRATFGGLKSNELYVTNLAPVTRNHLSSSGGLRVPFFPSSPRDNFVPMISPDVVFPPQLCRNTNRSHSAS